MHGGLIFTHRSSHYNLRMAQIITAIMFTLILTAAPYNGHAIRFIWWKNKIAKNCRNVLLLFKSTELVQRYVTCTHDDTAFLYNFKTLFRSNYVSSGNHPLQNFT